MIPNNQKISLRAVSNGWLLSTFNWSGAEGWLEAEEFVFQDERCLMDEIHARVKDISTPKPIQHSAEGGSK